MTPRQLAAIHSACFTTPRPWTESEMADLLANKRVFLLAQDQGFLLGRVIADEAELLTIAVLPEARGRGVGAALVANFLVEAAARGAAQAFLEVAETNGAARALYSAAGFLETGRRKGYYSSTDGAFVDAIVMSRGVRDHAIPD